MTVPVLRADHQRDKQQHAAAESDAQRAAAWAWYQRSGGRLNQAAAPGAGKSEAFATRCCSRRPLSRFFREASRHARTRLQQPSSDSSLFNCASTLSARECSSRSQFTGYGGTDVDDDELSDLPETFSSNGFHLGDEAIVKGDMQPPLDLVSVGACWDCGSSLFDTFELVAMSQKLDAELHEPHIEAQSDLANIDQLSKQPLLLQLCDKPYSGAISPIASPPRDHGLLNSSEGSCDELTGVHDKDTKQAVYDMFCRYGEAADKQMEKLSSDDHSISTNLTCGENRVRKYKHKQGRMHGMIARAFHHLMHASTTSLGNTDHAAMVLKDHHHHHHLHYSPLRHGKGAMPLHTDSRWVGDQRLSYDTPSGGCQQELGSHPKQKHVHHHHHHHYHYLFHSDDDFRLQPLDKSLMVAAAGLRSPKLVSPALSSYLESPARMDQSKWADFGSSNYQ